jgi:hypothetical protein
MTNEWEPVRVVRLRREKAAKERERDTTRAALNDIEASIRQIDSAIRDEFVRMHDKDKEATGDG